MIFCARMAREKPSIFPTSRTSQERRYWTSPNRLRWRCSWRKPAGQSSFTSRRRWWRNCVHASATCSSIVTPPLRSEYRSLQEVAMRVPLRRTRSWLLLVLCLMALIVLDPTAVPPRRLWYQELTRLKRQLDAMPSDFEKTTFLRQYVGGLIDIGRPDDRTRHLHQSVNFENFDAAEFYPRFRGHSLPAECGITTFFYIKLLQAFGFKAYQYSFGFTEKPYARFIHSIVLVKIDFQGTQRLIIQDPYLDLTYRNPEGAPIDFFDFLAALKRKDFEHIVMDASSVTTSLQVPEPSSYYPFLSESCRVSMTAALRREDGSLRTRIPI